MKKIGREVLFLNTKENNPRNGEGGFIRLKDGSVMLVYSAYCGADWSDHAVANLSAYISHDEGETWEGPKVIVEKDETAQNIMSTSLLRMNNGDIGLFYIQKLVLDGNICDEILLRRSSDEGETWSEPTVCIPPDDYRVLNNDRVVKLRNGRILIPIALHSLRMPGIHNELQPGVVSVFISDDDGFMWHESQKVYKLFDNDDQGLQEPGVYELPDGRIWMFIRTCLGFQFESFSSDGGETWSKVRPNRGFTTPLAPMQVKDVGKYTAAIYNPVPTPCGPILAQKDWFWKVWGRTPLVVSVSEDKGSTYPMTFYLEDDINEDYCYPAIIEGKDYFLAAYYHSNGSGVALNSLKVVKVSFDELCE